MAEERGSHQDRQSGREGVVPSKNKQLKHTNSLQHVIARGERGTKADAERRARQGRVVSTTAFKSWLVRMYAKRI